MRKTASLLFKLAILAVGGYGLWLNFSSGGFWRQMNYYTLQTNVMAWLSALAGLVYTAANLKRVPIYRLLRGGAMIWITVTMIVYYAILYPNFARTSDMNQWAPANYLMHLIVPSATILDFFLFEPRGQMRKIDPALWAIYPLLYAGVALLRAVAGVNAAFMGDMKVPYFFLDYESLGWPRVGGYCAAITLGFLLVGYLMYGLDRIGKAKAN